MQMLTPSQRPLIQHILQVCQVALGMGKAAIQCPGPVLFQCLGLPRQALVAVHGAKGELTQNHPAPIQMLMVGVVVLVKQVMAAPMLMLVRLGSALWNIGVNKTWQSMQQ
jgi:methyl coenzyme M reductase subunit C